MSRTRPGSRRVVGLIAVLAATSAFALSTPASAHVSGSRSRVVVTAQLADSSITADQRAVVHGTASPAAPHAAAHLQLRSGARWVTVATTRLTSSSGFSFRYRTPDVGRFVLRVAVVASSVGGERHSNRLDLTVSPSPYLALATDVVDTTCAVVRGGTVQCWGRPLNDSVPAPIVIPGLTRATAVATTDDTICAIVGGGAVDCVGSNYPRGERGSPATPPVRLAGLTHAVTLVGGAGHFCAIRRDRSTWCWGDDTDDELGVPAGVGVGASPVRVPGLGPATSLAAGPAATCATVKAGGVLCWGRPINDSKASDDSPTPTLIDGISGKALTVSIGDSHACAVINTGRVECWGDNTFGELGNATSPATTSAIVASGITTARTVSAGSSLTCVVLRRGAITCFGANSDGEVGNGDTGEEGAGAVRGINDATSVLASDGYACALVAHGAATCWGDNTQAKLGGDAGFGGASDVPRPVAPLAWHVSESASRTSVHAGQAIRVTGSVSPPAPGRTVTLVASNYGRVLRTFRTTLSSRSRYAFAIPTTSVNVNELDVTVGRSATHTATTDFLSVSVKPVIVSLAVGHGHGCAAASTGEAFCWGDGTDVDLGPEYQDSYGPYEVTHLPASREVAAGLDFSCALLRSGHVDCWGGDSLDQLGDGPGAQIAGAIEPVTGIANATAIAAGDNTACALLATGAVKCWGDGADGQLGNGSDQNSPTPVAAVGIANATAITIGASHACALLKTATVKCWGANGDGQLGRGSFAPSGTPVKVTGLSHVVAVSAGASHTCALLASGKVSCWGDNDDGQLGSDQPTNHNAPVAVTGIATAVSLGAGGSHTCVVLKSGTVECWGQGDLGELGNGQLDTTATPVTVKALTDAASVVSGFDNTCAVLHGDGDTGDVWCWGNNSTGQDGDFHVPGDYDEPIQVFG